MSFRISLPKSFEDSTPVVYTRIQDLFDPMKNRLWVRGADDFTGARYAKLVKSLWTWENLKGAPHFFFNNWWSGYSFNTGDQDRVTALFGCIPEDKLWLLHFLNIEFVFENEFRATRFVGELRTDVAYDYLRINDWVSSNLRGIHCIRNKAQWDEKLLAIIAAVENNVSSLMTRLEECQRWLNIGGFGSPVSTIRKLMNMIVGEAYINAQGQSSEVKRAWGLYDLISARPNTNYTLEVANGWQDGGSLTIALRLPIDRNNRSALYQVFSYTTNPLSYLPPKMTLPKEYEPNLYGVELECSTDYSVQDLIDACDEPFFIAKHDSSVTGSKRNPYELVTAPSSFKFLKKQYALWFNKLDYSKFDTTTQTNNGLHIHVGNSHFDDDNHRRNFCWFYHNPCNQDFIVAVSERGSVDAMRSYTPFASFENRTSQVRSFRDTLSITRGVRGVTNLGTGKPTIEVRMFKGIVSYASIVKNLEFVDSVFYFTRETHMAQLDVSGYMAWLGKTPVNKYQVLKKFLDQIEIEPILLSSRVRSIIFNEKDPEKIADKLNKSRMPLDNEVVSFINRGRKRTFVFNKETHKIEVLVNNKGKLWQLDREIEKRYLPRAS